jgi:hypothetical protein
MDLALVGLVVPGIENQSLAALRHAARAANREVCVVPFGGFAGMERTVAEVLRARPRVCGVSIQTSESILAAMCLTHLLRGRGFAGTIVCGGHFATLHAREILELGAGVDAVVRFAGEGALVALLSDPDPGELERIPGLLWRDAGGAIHEGAPAQPISATPSVPVIDRALPHHLGFPAADLIASRGCESECGYCCVAGASRMIVAEARRAGVADPRSWRYERRDLRALADEMASLHHAHGARVFTFMDDNVLPNEPAAVASFARSLRAELDARRVPPIAVALQIRADAVDGDSADALAALGLARAYVGIDGYSPLQLRTLGRHADASAGPHAVSLLRERGVLSVCNALAIGPTVELPALEREIEGMARLSGAPVHLLPIEVRQGSTLFDRASRRGLVEGGFLHRTYRFADIRTARVGRILFALPTRLRERSVPVAMYDLAYNLGIALRLLPSLDATRWLASWDRLAREWNADQVRLLREAIAAARDSDDAVTACIARELAPVTARDHAWLTECDQLVLEIERATEAHRGTPSRAHHRSRILGAVAAAMSLSACSSSGDPDDRRDAMLLGVDGGSDGGDGIDTAAPLDAGACRDPLRTLGPMSGDRAIYTDTCRPSDAPRVRAQLDEDGEVISFDAITEDGGVVPLTEDVRTCLEMFFARHCYPSSAGGELIFEPHFWIA